MTTRDDGPVVMHEVVLTDLSPGTAYSFKVISVDGAGNLVESEVGSFTTPGDADFSVDFLKIRPGRVSVGKQVTIRAKVTNSGAVADDCEVQLTIDGVVEAVLLVTLAPGEAAEVRFVVTADAAGTYVVDVNGASGSLVVRESSQPHGPKK